MESRILIVGVGDDGPEGLSESVRDEIAAAEVLMGPAHLLRRFEGGSVARCEIGVDLDAAVETLERHADRRTVVLADGDPLFYGTARYLCDHLGKDRFEVRPHVSSMQLAFARVKENWDDAYLADARPENLSRICERIRTAEKVGLFTNDQTGPAQLARALLDHRIDYFSAYVCENLGSPDERVTHGSLRDLAEQSFGPLNVVVLVREPWVPDRPREMRGKRLFGNPDTMFLQSQPKRGLLTPAEVRSVALAELDLGPSSTVWDVGAGSGSVAVEAAQIARDGAVYAIERDPEDHQLIRSNAERFGVSNLVPVLGAAPEAWDALPDPDAVFIGGTGRQVAGIVQAALSRLRPGGRIVANVVSWENLSAVQQVLTERVGEVEVWMIQVSRGMPQFDMMRLESLNPTFLIAAVQPRESGGDDPS